MSHVYSVSRVRRVSHWGNQTGFSLVMSLVMLVVLTVLVISSLMLSNLGLRITGNAQARVYARNLAQEAINTKISTEAYFTSPPTSNTETSSGDYTVTVYPPSCTASAIASGNSITQTVTSSLNTSWEIVATTVDGLTKACVEVHQGIKVQLPSGSTCPNGHDYTVKACPS